ncbi:MAG: hypothetical protein ACRYF3_08255 [Janthinobacterium lividum]
MQRVLADVTVAVLAALVAAALALDRTDLWDMQPHTVVLFVALAAALAIATSVSHAVAAVRAQRRNAQRDLLEDLLQGSVWAIADATHTDPRDLAVAAYETRTPWVRRWRGARLARLHRVRAGRRPAASGTVWTPGKGVIGTCVATGTVVARDLTALEARLDALDPAGWDALPESDRQGLTREEFTRLRGRYPVVVAVPVVDDTGSVSDVVGCLALDGPAGSLPALSRPEVLGILEASARAVARLGRSTTPATRFSTAQTLTTPGEDLLRAALRRTGGPR